MSPLRRPFIALAIAAGLPTLIAVSGAMYAYLHSYAEQLKGKAALSAETISAKLDTNVNADLAVLNVLGSSAYLQQHNWDRFYEVAQRLKEKNPDWETLCVLDMKDGTKIFDLRQQLGAATPLQLAPELEQKLKKTTQAVVGNIVRDPQPVIYFYQPIKEGLKETAGPRYVVALGMRPDVYQRVLLRNANVDTTAAIVDRQGSFIARNLNFEQRVATPGTQHLRMAIQRGSSGIYQGVTWEGVSNYTAFYTSPITGWSAHVAIPSSTLDLLAAWSYVLVGLTAVGGIALAVVLMRLVLLDIDNRRNNEEALRQSQKMEAVGRLTGGIAHDFNNLLTPLIGNLDLVRRQVTDERLRRMLDNALEAARRGAKLSSRLLAFSRKQKMQLQAVDLRELLSGMAMLLRHSLGPTIILRIDISDDANIVSTDPSQLELALLNLAVNARDAMPTGGTLLIASRAVHQTMPHLQEGVFAEIQVSDEGQGMSEAVRERALEPFFTTKKDGQGTGLGLAQVYGIVRESGGEIRIASEPGRGTTVYLYLPLADTPSVGAPATRPITRILEGAAVSGKILVVDDNVDVKNFAVEALQSQGYTVVGAANSDEAVAAVQTQRFDLLLIDFMMENSQAGADEVTGTANMAKHANGAEVARQLKQMQPDLRIMLMSGHADTAAIAMALGEVRFLPKPFDVEQLRKVVAEVLGDQ